MAELYERHASLLRAATEVSTYDDEVRVFWRGNVERFIEATAADLRGERSRGGCRAVSSPSRPPSGERSAHELVGLLGATWTAALYPAPARRGEGRDRER